MAKYQRVATDINGLTEEKMRAVAPSIFAEGAHMSRSDRYVPIPTIEVLKDLQKYGFVPTTVMQSVSRDETKRGFTRHLVRLTPQDALGWYDSRGHEYKRKKEVVLVNSYDGTSAYELRFGVLEMLCANGMIAGTDLDFIKILHKGNPRDIAGQVVEGSLKIINQGEEVMATIEEMQQYQLDRQEQLIFAKQAMQAKFGTPEEGQSITDLTIYQPQDFLKTRHAETRNDKSIWQVGNDLEENMMNPDGKVYRFDARGKKHTTRATTSIRGNLNIHECIWGLQKELLEYKKSQH